MTTATTTEPGPDWEGGAARWAVRLALGVALGVGGLWAATTLWPGLVASTAEPEGDPKADDEKKKKMAAAAAAAAAAGGILEAENRKRRGNNGCDCGDGCDIADCSCEALDCAGDCSAADCSAGDCSAADCGGCDCGAVDCGGCAVARPAARAGCRRGAPWGTALALAAPMAIFAAWRRLPTRQRDGEGEGGEGGGRSGGPGERDERGGA